MCVSENGSVQRHLIMMMIIMTQSKQSEGRHKPKAGKSSITTQQTAKRTAGVLNGQYPQKQSPNRYRSSSEYFLNGSLIFYQVPRCIVVPRFIPIVVVRFNQHIETTTQPTRRLQRMSACCWRWKITHTCMCGRVRTTCPQINQSMKPVERRLS